MAVIPARGGSRRVPGKNLVPLGGESMLARTISCAQESGVLGSVWVNSEDRPILAEARHLGAQAYARPRALAGDRVFIIEVLKEMILSLDLAPSQVLAVLLTTCPLRRPQDVSGAMALFNQHDQRLGVATVSRFATPIHLAQFQDQEGRLLPVFPEDYARSTRSTDHRPAYHFNEAVVINTAAGFLSQKTLIGPRPLAHEMPPERSLMIDYPFQMEFARMMFAQADQP